MREKIVELAREYFSQQLAEKKIVPGTDYIPASGKVLCENDMENLMHSCLDMWLTAGEYAEKFEAEFATFMEQKHSLFVNSGSSANLLAFSTLTSPLLKKRRIVPGDEVITAACGFPTTVNPIVQNGCVPVFVDVDLGTYEANLEQIESAITEKTKAIMIAHTLGNAFAADKLRELCDQHGLWLIEDCCDAVGARINGKMVGTFGHLATVSFYPAHHMTTGEGGAVLTSDPLLNKIAASFRDWGRDCWCPSGKDNTCGKRFKWKIGDLPRGFDHKYIYSHIGYNLKATDMQASIGLTQLKKVDGFVKKRRENFQTLHQRLEKWSDQLILPRETPGTDASWFGFVISVKDVAKASKQEMVRFLEENKIGTRELFAANIVRHPLYKGVEKRVVGDLANSDFVLENSFWVGVWPGLGEEHMNYIADKIDEVLS